MLAAGRQNVNTDKIMSDRVPGICTMERKGRRSTGYTNRSKSLIRVVARINSRRNINHPYFRHWALHGRADTHQNMSASLIGRSGSSAFRLSTTTVSMSLTGSCFSTESAPRPLYGAFFVKEFARAAHLFPSSVS
jgi:hypothetical protein